MDMDDGDEKSDGRDSEGVDDVMPDDMDEVHALIWDSSVAQLRKLARDCKVSVKAGASKQDV